MVPNVWDDLTAVFTDGVTLTVLVGVIFGAGFLVWFFRRRDI